MGDPFSARSTRGQTLRNKFELELRRLSYTDFHYEDVKNRLNMAASPSNHTQKVGNKDEMIRHMSNLPSYLETRKDTPDRALSFGVMDWGKLEKWQYQHLNRFSPSSSSSSPLFSTEGSTPQSTRGQRCSPSGQRPHRVTLQSHFNTSSSLGNVNKFQDFKGNSFYHRAEKKTEPKVCKLYESRPPKRRESIASIDTGNYQTKSVFLKGKMQIEDPFYRTRELVQIERHKTLVLSSTVSHGNGETNEKNRSYRNNTTLEERRSSFSSKNSDHDTGNFAANKLRSMSPIRRFSFSNTRRVETPVSGKSTVHNSTRVSNGPQSSPLRRSLEPTVSGKSMADNNTRVSNRPQSSPLRRLLEPLFPLKTTNSRQCTEIPRSKIKAKSKLNLRNDTYESTSTRQAIFQTAVNNGRPMFTFAVENNNNKMLAATVRDLSSSAKDNSSRWIYTFFTVDEIKKKNGSWLSNSRKDKAHDYVPNITAQMTVTNRSIYNSDTREFSLFCLDLYDELAAIVVKFSRNVDGEEENEERFSTTVILPGGNHGVSTNGKPSPLTDRWRSGGVCDCGGWDLGCRLRILTNQVQPSRRSNSATGQFELFFQGDVTNDKRFFSLCPIKEGIFSVDYNSSLSPLQAFSICISVLECRKSSQHTESTTYVAKQVHDDLNPVRFASIPPLSPVGRV